MSNNTFPSMGPTPSPVRSMAECRALLRASALPSLLPFTKMEGLGNDYIYVEEFDAPLADPVPLAVAVSERHFGVGGDGLVLMGHSDVADFRMRIFNADGSEAEMCGNATRCVGKYLYETGRTGKREITLETLSGIRELFLEVDGHEVRSVRVSMGKPSFAPGALPMLVEGASFIDREFSFLGGQCRGTAVSMGNPHLVVPFAGFAPGSLPASATAIDALDLPTLGPLFERHPLFPRRVNTEFVETPERGRIRMRVWERGSGETMACGTGACAALVACAMTEATDRKARVELPGGALFIEWAEDGVVYMSGPAAFVYSGEYRVR